MEKYEKRKTEIAEFAGGQVKIEVLPDHVQKGSMNVVVTITKPGWKPQVFDICDAAHGDSGKEGSGMNEHSVILPRIFNAIWEGKTQGENHITASPWDIEAGEKAKRELETIREAFQILKGSEQMSDTICNRTDCKKRNKTTGRCNHGGPGYITTAGSCGSFDKILTPSERAIKVHETMWENAGRPTTVHLALYCVDTNPIEMGRDAFACHSKPKHFGDETVLRGLTGELGDVTCEKCINSKLFKDTVVCLKSGEDPPEDMTPYEFKARTKEVQ
jgi:hypothetical protein